MGKGSVRQGAAARHLSPSLLPRGLRERLIVAFGLMSVVPLLVMGYVVTNYVFPHLDSIGDVSLVVGLSAVIALLGLSVARGLVMPVIRLASQAQEIAQGNLERVVDVEGAGEVGSLGSALNQITQRVRENMSQLRVYGEQTKHLNLEINRRILTLSHLLQVSNLISQSAKIEEVITFILEKLTQIEEAELNCILEAGGEEGVFLVRAAVGTDARQASALQGTKIVAPWLWKALQERRITLLDAAHSSRAGEEFFGRVFGMTNAVCQPVVSMGQGIGLLICANRKPDFSFQEDCLDLLKVFGKQVTIAIENDLLTKRAEELKVIDELTGLYNAGYMRSRLEEEVRRAIRYHRPCSLLLLNLDNFEQLQQMYGGLAGEGVLHQVAELLKGQATDVDRVGRMGPDEFALILPERNKRQAIDLGEAIRRAVEGCVFRNGNQPLPRSVTLSAGLSENPLDGSTAEELFAKAAQAVRSAKGQGKNRVVSS